MNWWEKREMYILVAADRRGSAARREMKAVRKERRRTGEEIRPLASDRRYLRGKPGLRGRRSVGRKV